MKKRNAFFVLLLSFSLLIFGDLKVNAEVEQNLENVIKKREEFGLFAEKETIAKLVKNEQISNDFGIYMSKEEEGNLKKRFEKFTNSVEAWRNFLKTNETFKENFLDLYVEHNKNTLVHLIFKNEITQAEKQIISTFFDNVVIEYGKYSGENLSSEIDGFINELKTNEQKIEKFIIYEDLPKQKVMVEVEKNDYEKAKKVKEDIIKKEKTKTDLIDVKISENKIIKKPYLLPDRDEYYRPLLGGLVVRKGSSTGPSCSSGFPALKDNKVYFITAGHCSPVSTGYFQGGSYIGHMSFRKTGGNVDAGAIYVGNIEVLSNVYNYSYKLNQVEVAGNDIIGDRVCKSGMNGSGCGTLIKKDYVGRYENSSTPLYEVKSLRVGTFYATHGDSGGTVFEGNTLKGIVTGPATVNGEEYVAYTHVSHIQNELGITPITWK